MRRSGFEDIPDDNGGHNKLADDFPNMSYAERQRLAPLDAIASDLEEFDGHWHNAMKRRGELLGVRVFGRCDGRIPPVVTPDRLPAIVIREQKPGFLEKKLQRRRRAQAFSGFIVITGAVALSIATASAIGDASTKAPNAIAYYRAAANDPAKLHDLGICATDMEMKYHLDRSEAKRDPESRAMLPIDRQAIATAKEVDLPCAPADQTSFVSVTPEGTRLPMTHRVYRYELTGPFNAATWDQDREGVQALMNDERCPESMKDNYQRQLDAGDGVLYPPSQR